MKILLFQEHRAWNRIRHALAASSIERFAPGWKGEKTLVFLNFERQAAKSGLRRLPDRNEPFQGLRAQKALRGLIDPLGHGQTEETRKAIER